MACPRCQMSTTPGARFCSGCGAPIGATAYPPGVMQTSGPTGSAGPGAGRPQANIDFRRLGIGDLVAGGAIVVLFVALFLPWYSIGYGGVSVSTSAMGSGAGGWRVLVLVVAVLTLGYLLVRTIWSTPRLPIPHWQFLTVLTVLLALLTLLAFLVKPGVDTTGLGGTVIGSSWSYGAYIGLVAALAAVGGAVQRSRQSETIEPTRHAAVRPSPGSSAARSDYGSGHGQPGASPGAAGPAVLQAASTPQGPWQAPGVPKSPASHTQGGSTPDVGRAGPCGACGVPVVPGNQFCLTCGTRYVP